LFFLRSPGDPSDDDPALAFDDDRLKAGVEVQGPRLATGDLLWWGCNFWI